MLFHEAFTQQVADGFLLINFEYWDGKAINVGRIEFGLSTAAHVLLCLKLPDGTVKLTDLVPNQRLGKSLSC